MTTAVGMDGYSTDLELMRGCRQRRIHLGRQSIRFGDLRESQEPGMEGRALEDPLGILDELEGEQSLARHGYPYLNVSRLFRYAGESEIFQGSTNYHRAVALNQMIQSSWGGYPAAGIWFWRYWPHGILTIRLCVMVS